MAGKTAGKAFMWVLMGLLMLGLAGFGIGSFSGGASTIGKVGDETITTQAYFRALQNASRAAQAQAGRPISFAELQAQGVPGQVQRQLVSGAALDNEAKRLGLSVGDGTVAEQIRSERAFTGLDGSFDRQAYEFTLRNQGWSVREFETQIRKETARTLLQGSVGTGIVPPAQYLDLVLDHYGERRSYDWVRFGDADLVDDLPEPDTAQIQAFYESAPELFTLPERKQVTYAWLSPETLIDTIEPDEAALRDLYDSRRSFYVQPERRLVERLVFPDQAAAEAAKAQVDSGETTFTALVEGRGLRLEDVDLGEATRESLGDAGDAVFDLGEPGIVGPFDTNLGPALFRMNAILNATEVTFEEARDELAQEFARDAARREVEARINDLDDQLAAGATLEDLTQETEMVLGQVEVWPGASGGLVDYAEFREQVEQLTEEDFPQILTLDDGGVYAMRLEAVLPPSLQPLDAVRDRAVEGAAAQIRTDALREIAETALTKAQATDGGLATTGPMESAELVTRDVIPPRSSPLVTARVFEMAPGDFEIVEAPEAVYLVQLRAVEGPAEDEQTAFLRNGLGAQLSQGLSQDMILLFSQAMTAQAGFSFDERALNAVHTQIFTGGQ